MFNLGPMEMLVIVVVALVVLGPQRLPDAMRQVGKGVGDLRRWSTQLTTEVQSAFVPGAERGPAHPGDATAPVPATEPLPGQPSVAEPVPTAAPASAAGSATP